MTESMPSKETAGILAQPIVPHVQLLAIELMMASSARFPELDQRGEFNAPLRASDQVRAVYHDHDRRIIAAVQFEVNAEDEKAKLASWSAVYRLVYHVSESYLGDQINERAEAFCQTYSTAHVWPYWREHLASQSAKMGLPTILAPILVVGATPVIQATMEDSTPRKE